MKKYLILYLLYLIFTSPLPAGAVKKMATNPVNLAAMIAEKGDSAHIEGYFKYYGYVKQETDSEGYTVMRHRNGDEMRYSFKDGDATLTYPTIIVKTGETPTFIEARLKELKFKKVGKTYESTNARFSNYLLHCTFGPGNTLIFHTTEKP